jgi:bifunctional non-homologous end joining protein LigD
VTLETYKRKRDFARTPEPAGEVGRPSQAGGRFVVQRHRATRLHYDFRLEIDGVLMSWAVPKGPTLDPAPRRMAARTEDHPLDYFDFEGVIPAGQYGGGDVIVWDWGTFEPEKPEDPGAAVRKGELKFVLHGQKLRGRYTLVRTSARDEWGQAEKEEWLLIKKRDEHARDAWDAEDHPQSVKSGRTNDEVKDGRDAVWISGAPAPEAAIEQPGLALRDQMGRIPGRSRRAGRPGATVDAQQAGRRDLLPRPRGRPTDLDRGARGDRGRRGRRVRRGR